MNTHRQIAKHIKSVLAKRRSKEPLSIVVRRVSRIIEGALNERARQEHKWGEQNHDFPIWLAIFSEEFGEISQAFLKLNFAAAEAAGAKKVGKKVDTRSISQRGIDFRTEMIQGLAVLMAMIECGDRNGWFGK